jgi:hypothetical protein
MRGHGGMALPVGRGNNLPSSAAGSPVEGGMPWMPPLMPGAGRPGGSAVMRQGGMMGDAGMSGFGTGGYDNPFAQGAWQGNDAMLGAHMPGAGMMNRMV